MYDLNLFPINQMQGKPQAANVGFLAVKPPRRAARSRSEDLLVVSFFTRDDSGWLDPERVASWLADLSEAFFKTGGSVTSALRTFIDSLNVMLLEKNLKAAKDGTALTGAINLAAVHRQSVYIVQSGFAHAFTLTQAGLGHYYDNSQTDRGLGLSRTPKIRYYQADLGDEGYLFLTDKPPITWTEDLLNFGGFPKIAQLRRRLLNQASPNFRLDLVHIMPGQGQIKIAPSGQPEPEKDVLKPSGQPEKHTEKTAVDVKEVPGKPEPEVEPVVQDDTGQVAVHTDAPAPEALDLLSSWVAETPEEPSPMAGKDTAPETFEEDVAARVDDDIEDDMVVEVADEVDSVLVGESEPQRRPKTRTRRASEVQQTSTRQRQSFSDQVARARESGLRGLASFLKWSRQTRTQVGAFFNQLLFRIGLTDEDGFASLSNRTLLIITLVIPLVVVGIAVGVYLGRGRSLQFQYYLDQAEIAVVEARMSQDPDSARQGWSQAMMLLEQAESLRRSDQAALMRTEAQRALDALDGALRLSFHPALTGALSQEVNITRILSYGLDLYMLDAVAGRVIHASRTSQGYRVEGGFLCGAGNFSGGAIDRLVDIVPMPLINPYQAHLLGTDALGNVIYCSPGSQPVVQTLPSGGGVTGAVARIALEGNLLYVLDPSADAIRVYRATNGQFLDPPTIYFGSAAEGVKPPLTQVVDLAINGAEMYLLRNDGMLVHCVATGLDADPVKCDNPVSFVDGRPGKEDQPVMMPTSSYIALQYTAPPEPAVNILDAENADIFRYSLRFRLNRRLRSDFGSYEVLSPTATAFTIGVDRIAFMAFGHQVFFAYVE